MPASNHVPADWHASAAIHAHCDEVERARALLHAFGMTLFSRSIHRVAEIVGRVFGRLAAVIVGFTMMMLGLGMTTTIVLLPAGVVVGLLGVAIFVGGLARPRDGTAG